MICYETLNFYIAIEPGCGIMPTTFTNYHWRKQGSDPFIFGIKTLLGNKHFNL